MKRIETRKKDFVFWILALCLLLLAFFQIALIFGNPFESEQSIPVYEVKERAEANLLEPEMIYLTLGGENQSSYVGVDRSEESFFVIFDDGYALLEKASEEILFQACPAEKRLQQRQTLVFAFDFEIGRSAILSQLPSLKELPEGSWNQLWILPSRIRGEIAEFYLYNSETGSCLGGQMGEREWSRNLLLEKDIADRCLEEQKRFVNLDQALPGVYRKSDFVSEPTEKRQLLRGTASSYFTEDGVRDLDRMMNYALGFFESKDTVTSRENGGNLLLNNEKISVQMDPSGLMEYVETLTDEEKTPVDMAEAYQLAVDFIKADMKRVRSVQPDFVLSGIDRKEDSYTFYFNYTLGGIPLRMETVKSVRWGMSYPIEITVKGEKVRRCRRYVLDIAVSDEVEYSRGSWLKAADVLAGNWNLMSPPKLVYYVSGNTLVAKWEAWTDQGRAWFTDGIQ